MKKKKTIESRQLKQKRQLESLKLTDKKMLKSVSSNFDLKRKSIKDHLRSFEGNADPLNQITNTVQENLKRITQMNARKSKRSK